MLYACLTTATRDTEARKPFASCRVVQVPSLSMEESTGGDMPRRWLANTLDLAALLAGVGWPGSCTGNDSNTWADQLWPAIPASMAPIPALFLPRSYLSHCKRSCIGIFSAIPRKLPHLNPINDTGNPETASGIWMSIGPRRAMMRSRARRHDSDLENRSKPNNATSARSSGG